MEAALIVILLCSVVALSSACCTPDQWEGGESFLTGYTRLMHPGISKGFAHVSYDAVKNRTAVFLEEESQSRSFRFQIVTRYQNATSGKVYILDLKSSKCYTHNLSTPFRKSCLPPEAKPIGNFTFGLSTQLKATGYEMGMRNIEAFITVEPLGNNQCAPISEAIYGREGLVNFIQTIGFINMTRGIKNETVFDVPKGCKESTNEDFSFGGGLKRDHFVFAL